MAALGLLVLECLIDVPRRFYVAALIASVAIDLDHIPLYLGLLGNEDERPVTHSLATVIYSSSRRLPSAGIEPCWPGRRPAWCSTSRGTSLKVRQAYGCSGRFSKRHGQQLLVVPAE